MIPHDCVMHPAVLFCRHGMLTDCHQIADCLATLPLLRLQLLGVVRTRRSGRLPGASPASTSLPDVCALPLAAERQPQDARTARDDFSCSAGQTHPAQQADDDSPSWQHLAADGRTLAQHSSAPKRDGDAASAALPDPPTVLELVIGDEVRLPGCAPQHAMVEPSSSQCRCRPQTLFSASQA